MFENIVNFFKKLKKTEKNIDSKSKETAKERLHLVLMQDRANVSADFLDMMKQEIIEVIKKYIDIDEKAIDVKLTNKMNDDGTVGAPALYANIPIVTIKNEARQASKEDENKEQENNTSSSEENITKDENPEENNEKDTKEESAEIKIEEPESDKENASDVEEESKKEDNENKADNNEPSNEKPKENTDNKKANK
jgi:cell division topological specificity factor